MRQVPLKLVQHRSVTPGRAELSEATVLSAQQGDRQAQAMVLTRYAAVVHQLVRRIAGEADVDALVQGVLERVLVALPKFDVGGSASLTTWVFTVAHHFLVDQKRRTRLVVVPVESASHAADERADPHTAAWRGQLRDVLERAIAQLPDDQRRVFVLVQVHEHPLEAVAEAERIPLGTVKSRLFRAKARLAHALAPRFDAEGDHGER